VPFKGRKWILLCTKILYTYRGGGAVDNLIPPRIFSVPSHPHPPHPYPLLRHQVYAQCSHSLLPELRFFVKNHILPILFWQFEFFTRCFHQYRPQFSILMKISWIEHGGNEAWGTRQTTDLKRKHAPAVSHIWCCVTHIKWMFVAVTVDVLQ